MSAQKTYSIRCPRCGQAQKTELYESINVAQQPELKTALFENRLNRVHCEACEASFRVDKPLLYHDPDRGLLVQWLPDRAVPRENLFDEFDRTLEELRAALPAGAAMPCVRLVFTRSELVERIFLLEAGLEERVVEYIKYAIYTANPERIPPRQKQLLLNVQDSTAEELLFAVQDVETLLLEEVLRYPRAAYRDLRERHRRRPEELEELFPAPHISARSALLAEQELDDPQEESLEEPSDDL